LGRLHQQTREDQRDSGAKPDVRHAGGGMRQVGNSEGVGMGRQQRDAHKQNAGADKVEDEVFIALVQRLSGLFVHGDEIERPTAE
jgi:hypothetical protein